MQNLRLCLDGDLPSMKQMIRKQNLARIFLHHEEKQIFKNYFYFLVASSNVNNGTMNIGKSGQKFNNNKKKPIAGDNFFKIANPKSDIGVQTDKDITEESGGFKAEATTTKKVEIIGTNPALFDFVDEWVKEISVKRFVQIPK